MTNVTVAYFDEVLKLAKKRAGELGIDTFVVASPSGTVGVKAADAFRGKKVVISSPMSPDMASPITSNLRRRTGDVSRSSEVSPTLRLILGRLRQGGKVQVRYLPDRRSCGRCTQSSGKRR